MGRLRRGWGEGKGIALNLREVPRLSTAVDNRVDNSPTASRDPCALTPSTPRKGVRTDISLENLCTHL